MRIRTRESLWTRDPVLDADYAAATGRLRVLEDKMLSNEDLKRLAAGAGFAERADMLERAGYTGEGSLENRVMLGRDRNDELLKEITAEGPLATFLLLDLDYHNAKAIIRYLALLHLEQRQAYADESGAGEAAAQDTQKSDIPASLRRLMRETAPTNPEVLYKQISAMMRGDAVRGGGEIRPLFVEHLENVVRIASEGSELSDVDLLADKLCFIEMEAIAKSPAAKTMRDFLLDYLSVLADSANLETLFRIRRGKDSESFLEQAIVPGGQVPPEKVVSLYRAETAEILEAFKNTLLRDMIDEIEGYESREDIRLFGKAVDEILLKVASIGKRSTAGAESITGFWLGKKLEMKNLRIILQAVSRKLGEEKIKEMIRPAYKGYGL